MAAEPLRDVDLTELSVGDVASILQYLDEPLSAPQDCGVGPCHVAALIGGPLHSCSDPERRVCEQCAPLKNFTVPLARARYVNAGVGTWLGHSVCSYYADWQLSPSVKVQARAFPLAAAGGKLVLVVLPPGTDMAPVDEALAASGPGAWKLHEDVTFSPCSAGNTLCPRCNFASNDTSSCAIHSLKRPATAAAPSAATAAMTTTAAPPVDFSKLGPGVVPVNAPTGIVASSTLTHGPWAPMCAPHPMDAEQPTPAAPSVPPATTPCERVELDELNELVRSIPPTSQPSPTSPERELPRNSVVASEPMASGRGRGRGGSPSDSAKNLRVLQDLVVHGEAWKLGGSPQWRVLSDERVKEVLATFELGGGSLLHVVPRLFRYKGQPAGEQPYAGIIAQELPSELAPFCRFRTELSSDAVPPAAAVSATRATHPKPPAESSKPKDPARIEIAPALEVELSEPPGSEGSEGSDDDDDMHQECVPTGNAPPSERAPNARHVLTQAGTPWLYLVDLSALQFVALNAANELLQQVTRQQRQIDAMTTTGSDEAGQHGGAGGAELPESISELVGVLELKVRERPPDYSISPWWLVFNDPAVSARYYNEFNVTKRKSLNASITLWVGACFVVFVSALAIVSSVKAPSDLLSASFWASQYGQLVNIGAALSFTTLWHLPVGRRYPRMIDSYFVIMTTLLVCMEVSRSCFISDSGAGTCRHFDDPLHLSETRIGQDHLRWFNTVVLLSPLVFSNLGIPWAVLVMSQLAVASYLWRFSVHTYSSAELAGLKPFAMNLKMVFFFLLPHMSVLALAYVRIRAVLQLAAAVMRERRSADTFRELAEAARLEAPEAQPPESRQLPSRRYVACESDTRSNML